MKVAVVGAGGIGSVFGGRLAAAGHEVWLIHRRPEVVQALQRNGLHLTAPATTEPPPHPRPPPDQSPSVRPAVEPLRVQRAVQPPSGQPFAVDPAKRAAGLDLHIRLHATIDAAEVGDVDLVLITTKAFDTLAAAESARPLVNPSTCVLSLQNGLGNLETIAEVLGAERSLLGMTYLGAAVRGPGHVAFTAPGPTFIGEANAELSPRVLNLAEAFSAAGIPTQATDHLWDLVWGKLVINAALNAACALLGAGGDDILGSDAASQLTGIVAEETARVAAALGINLPYADAAERVWQHCHDIGSSKPSMLQDMERGRPTEIEAINGAVVRTGQRVGVPTPYNQALLLLVRASEQVRVRRTAH
ncbi:MAG: 2-dehydropantoate 2-reductase [Chloroflexi bacterium]|nr:2-dehydropantoate 2-reductase [Chloroflexota bacterium]